MKHSSAYVNEETNINLRWGEKKVLAHFFVSSTGLSKTPRNSEPNMNVMLKDHKKTVF